MIVVSCLSVALPAAFLGRSFDSIVAFGFVYSTER